MNYPMTEEQRNTHMELGRQFKALKTPITKGIIFGNNKVTSFWHIFNHISNPEYGNFTHPVTGDKVFEYQRFQELKDEIAKLSN